MEKERWLTRILRVVSNLTNILPSPLLENLLCARHRDETLQEFAIPEAATHTGQAVSVTMWRGSAAGLIETLHCVNMGEVKADSGPPSNGPGKLGEHTLDVSEKERCAWGMEGFTGQDT